MYNIKLEQFEGPLDLLLKMIESEELNISEISLAKVADQFVEYVVNAKCGTNVEDVGELSGIMDDLRMNDAVKTPPQPSPQRGGSSSPFGKQVSESYIDANEISDFLVIGAKLVYIKSKYLMPFLITQEDEEEIGDLETRLKIYKEFLDASKKIEEYYCNENYSFVREKMVIDGSIFLAKDGCGDTDAGTVEQVGFHSPKSSFLGLGDYVTLAKQSMAFFPPKKLVKEGLKNALEELIMRLKPSFKLEEAQFERRVTVQEKLLQIQKLILKNLEIGFSSLLQSREKSEVIVSFLAVLELVKQQFVFVEQEGYFSEIIIRSKN